MSYQQPFCRTEKSIKSLAMQDLFYKASQAHQFTSTPSLAVIKFLQMKIYEQVTQCLAWAEILSIPLKQDLIRNENTTNKYQCFSFKNA